MATRYSGQIVTNGLIFAIDAGSARSYPGSGTTLYDLSGNGNDALLESGSAVSASNGGVVSLDGANDRISVTDTNGDFDFGTGNFTINCWFKLIDGESTYPHIFALDDQSNFALKAIRPGLENELRLYVFQGYSVDFTNSFLVNNTWQMITLTRNGQEHKLYLDGVISDTVNDGSGPKSLSCSTVYIGWAWATEYNKQHRGPVQVYNRVLSAEEVLQNYNATKDRFD